MSKTWLLLQFLFDYKIYFLCSGLIWHWKAFFQNLQNKAFDHSAQILYCDFCVVGHKNNFRSFIGEVFVTLLHSSHLPLISLKSVRGGRHKRGEETTTISDLYRESWKFLMMNAGGAQMAKESTILKLSWSWVIKGESAAATTISELDMSISDDELQEELMGKYQHHLSISWSSSVRRNLCPWECEECSSNALSLNIKNAYVQTEQSLEAVFWTRRCKWCSADSNLWKDLRDLLSCFVTRFNWSNICILQKSWRLLHCSNCAACKIIGKVILLCIFASDIDFLRLIQSSNHAWWIQRGYY